MSASKKINRRILLNSRPTQGVPTAENFRLEQAEVPELKSGQVLLRNLYLSLDPYMRGRMSDAPSYVLPVPVDGVMEGGTVSRVEASTHPQFREGDLVLGQGGWQDYAVSQGDDLTRLNADLKQPSQALGILGMPGFTAYHGLLNIGQPRPGETVVVAAATGAVGSVVGQIAKLKGNRVVGIAGDAEKCRFAVETLGFDVCIDRQAPDFAAQLTAACPGGIDVYFENVGGAVFEAVIPLLNDGARVPVCGMIAHYNDTALPPGPNRVPLLMSKILKSRILVQGFIILDHYATEYAAFVRDMREWIAQGKVQVREQVVDSLEQAPQALIGLLQGENFGKVVVRVAND